MKKQPQAQTPAKEKPKDASPAPPGTRSLRSVPTEKPPQEQPRGQTIPLADVSFTVQREPRYDGEKGPTPVTIPGHQVATLLDWFIRCYWTGDVKLFTDPDAIGLHLVSLSETCRALSGSDWAEYNAEQTFYGLHCALDHLSHRLMAGEDTGLSEKATITIRRPAAKAA